MYSKVGLVFLVTLILTLLLMLLGGTLEQDFVFVAIYCVKRSFFQVLIATFTIALMNQALWRLKPAPRQMLSQDVFRAAYYPCCAFILIAWLHHLWSKHYGDVESGKFTLISLLAAMISCTIVLAKKQNGTSNTTDTKTIHVILISLLGTLLIGCFSALLNLLSMLGFALT
jgi:hypothetical protein